LNPCATGNCLTNSDLWAATMVDVGDLNLQDSSHPNVAPFKGTLLILDTPSDQAPHGSDGHPIEVSREVAEKTLKTLPGMGINYQSDLTGHNPPKKVGVITEASIDGDKVKVQGLIWKKDFPEAVRLFKANKGRLGMSMELGDVYVRDKDERVWHLEGFHFTGATVLLKDHAAYEATDLAAARFPNFVKALAAARSARGIFDKGGKEVMADKEKDKKDKGQSNGKVLVDAISAAVGKSVGDAFTTFATKQEETNKTLTKALESISASQEELVKGLHELALGTISAAADAEDAEVLSETIDAARGDATDSTDPTQDATDATDASDPTDASDVNADATDPTSFTDKDQDELSTPGDLNKNAEGHAGRNARSGAGGDATKAGGKSVSKGIAASKGTFVAKSMAAAKVIRSLKAENNELRSQNERLKNRVGSIEASLERYAERVERKSVSPEVAALLEKNGYDVRDLMGSKQRLSVSDVDQMLANAGVQLEPSVRAHIKNQLLQANMMEQGEVRRYN
jgi:regulator of replication initiation timing